MSDWIDTWIIHKVSGILVLSFIGLEIINRGYGIYTELTIPFQNDTLLIIVLSTGLVLQCIGGIGIFRSPSATLKRFAFGALYTVSGVELLLYAWSSILIDRPEICATVVTASGGDPIQLSLGEVSFLLVLGCFHWLDARM